MFKNKKILMLFVILSLGILLFACSNSSSTDGKDPGDDKNNEEINEEEVVEEEETLQFSNEDVTIKIATPWNEDYFWERIGNYVVENFPHFTLELVNWDGTSEHLQQLYADDIVPDVLLPFRGQLPLEETDSVFPLDEMVEKYGVDLSHIQPEIIEEIRSRDKDRRLVGIPQEVGYLGLYYNKEVFDLFGVEYPDPDKSMTWDELLTLSERLQGEVGGTKYCGLSFEDSSLYMAPLWQFSINLTDPETGEVNLTNQDEVVRWMQLMDRVFRKDPTQHDGSCSFWNKTTAMMIGWHGFMHTWVGGDTLEEVLAYKEPIDVVPLPVWADQPGITVSPQGIHPWAVNAHSENKEAAFQFALIGASEEYQMKMARLGTPAVLNSEESIEQLGADNELYHGKNVKAFRANTPQSPPEVKSRWDQFVEFDMTEFMESDMDVLEYLRVVEERATIKIKDVMGQQ